MREDLLPVYHRTENRSISSGEFSVTFSLPVYVSLLGRSYTEKYLKTRLIQQMQEPINPMMRTYSRQFTRWIEITMGNISKNYENYAERYRTHLLRVSGDTGLDEKETERIREDISLLKRE